MVIYLFEHITTKSSQPPTFLELGIYKKMKCTKPKPKPKPKWRASSLSSIEALGGRRPGDTTGASPREPRNSRPGSFCCRHRRRRSSEKGPAPAARSTAGTGRWKPTCPWSISHRTISLSTTQPGASRLGAIECFHALGASQLEVRNTCVYK